MCICNGAGIRVITKNIRTICNFLSDPRSFIDNFLISGYVCLEKLNHTIHQMLVRGKRESGEKPERSGHCIQGVKAVICHCRINIFVRRHSMSDNLEVRKPV